MQEQGQGQEKQVPGRGRIAPHLRRRWAVVARPNGQQIAAIKVLREVLGCSFKDAFDEVRSGCIHVTSIPTRREARTLARKLRDVGSSTRVYDVALLIEAQQPLAVTPAQIEKKSA